MNVTLSHDLETLVERQLETGRYGSAEEVVRDALLLLERFDGIKAELMEDLRRDIQIGLDELDRGEVVDAETVFAKLDRKAAALKTGA